VCVCVWCVCVWVCVWVVCGVCVCVVCVCVSVWCVCEVCVCGNSDTRHMITTSDLNKRDCPASGFGCLLSHIAQITVGCVVRCRLSVCVAYKRIHVPPRNASSNFAASSQPLIQYTTWDHKNILILCM